jgi:hydroxyquinol 1,2-dioxygenase
MIIKDQRDVTTAVLDELAKAPDARFREIMSSLIRHLHDFAREVKLTEQEFQRAIQYVVALGQQTNDSHNEAVLLSGSLGFSTLICLLNNGNGQTPTTANLLGPFWRMNSPRTQNGGSIVRSPTPGPPLFVRARVLNPQERPVEGAEVDVWHASPVGLYDIQDASQADMNLRGKFTTDAEGCFSFRTVKPSGYPIPISGVTGEFLGAQGRHNMRPAHLHFLISKRGYKTLISQVYVSDDPYIENDVQFGVTKAVVGEYLCHDDATGAPAGDVTEPGYSLEKAFVIEPGESRLPKPPIK